jgi:hypothetical protein
MLEIPIRKEKVESDIKYGINRTAPIVRVRFWLYKLVLALTDSIRSTPETLPNALFLGGLRDNLEAHINLLDILPLCPQCSDHLLF